MNKYTVEWLTSAENQLAALWMNAPDKQAVNAGTDAIDWLLAQDPIMNGSHVSEGLYRIVAPPLTAFYTIDDSTQTVFVEFVS